MPPRVTRDEFGALLGIAQDMGAAVPFDHPFHELNRVIIQPYLDCENREEADRLAEATRRQLREREPVPARRVAQLLAELVNRGLVVWLTVDDYGKEGHARDTAAPDGSDFALYDGYDCLNQDEHLARYDNWGPHLFRLTPAGEAEFDHPDNRQAYAEYFGLNREP